MNPLPDKRTPLVSVVLPTLNRCEVLPRAMASVLGQTFGDLELIVVDDGSTEDIASAAGRFDDSRVRVVRHEKNLGPSAARNTGLKEARGPYVAFQDSDDEWRLNKLERQLAMIRQEPETVLVVCGMLRYRIDGSLWLYPEQQFIPGLKSSPNEAVFCYEKAFTQTWLARRDALLRAGGFNQTLRIWEDWELLLRIAGRGAIRFDEEPLVISYITKGSVSSELPNRVKALQLVLQKYRDSGNRRLVSRLHYLIARYMSMNLEWRGSMTHATRALATHPGNVKAWVLSGMLLTGLWLPRMVYRER